MIKVNKIAAGAVRIIWCVPLFMLFFTSCFTGVESTPKIGASEVRSRSAAITEDQLYLDSIRHEPFELWKPGKRFVVSDPKISMIFQPSTLSTDISTNDTLLFVKAEEVVSPVGTAVEITLRPVNSTTPLVYRQNATLQELRQRRQVDIPFTIDLDLAETVREKLTGNKYYLVTPRWLDGNLNLVTRVKFIPATVVDVVPGTAEFPVRIIFNPEYQKIEPGSLYSTYMTVGSSPAATRNFDTIFSLKDPRRKYSNITDENWTAIIENRVLPGMTREEAKLSLGAPIDVDKGHDYSSIYEKWSYDGGIYLIFRDGLLETYRR